MGGGAQPKPQPRARAGQQSHHILRLMRATQLDEAEKSHAERGLRAKELGKGRPRLHHMALGIQNRVHWAKAREQGQQRSFLSRHAALPPTPNAKARP